MHQHKIEELLSNDSNVDSKAAPNEEILEVDLSSSSSSVM